MVDSSPLRGIAQINISADDVVAARDSRPRYIHLFALTQAPMSSHGSRRT